LSWVFLRKEWVAFSTLFLLLVSHSVLETARNTLFLTHLDSSILPYSYLAMGVLIWIIGRLHAWAIRTRFQTRIFDLAILLTSIGHVSFYVLMGSEKGTSSFALFIWTGLATSMLVAQFWIDLSSRSDITRAKKTYGAISATGIAGATLGGLLASVLLFAIEAEHLLLVASGFNLAALFLRKAFGPVRRCLPAEMPAEPVKGSSQAEVPLAERRYAYSIFAAAAALAVLSTMTELTFLSFVERSVDKESFGQFFGTFFAGSNALSFLIQIGLSALLFRRLGVARSLMILPLMALGLTGGFLMLMNPGFLYGLRAVDGALKNGLNRTAWEVLLVPLSSRMRSRAKFTLDGPVSRGGQAIAAFAVLGLTALKVDLIFRVYAIAALALLGVIGLVVVRRHYLRLFRSRVSPTAVDRLELPDLDMDLLGPIVAQLSHPDPNVVKPAVELLVDYEREELIPGLLLYHPSSDVVLRVFRIFIRQKRVDVLPIARSLLEQDNPSVRAAAVRFLGTVGDDVQLLRAMRGDPSVEVQASAIAALAVEGVIESPEAEADLGALIDERRTSQEQVLRSMADIDHECFRPILLRLTRSPYSSVRKMLSRILAKRPRVEFVPFLLSELPSRKSRPYVATALRSLGPRCERQLIKNWNTAQMDRAIENQVPDLLVGLGTATGRRALTRRWASEATSELGYRVLKGLGKISRDHTPLEFSLDESEEVLSELCSRVRSLRKSKRAIRSSFKSGGDEYVDVLVLVIDDIITNCIERVFRHLGLMFPDEDFESLYLGFQSGDPAQRTSVMEVMDHLLTGPTKRLVLETLEKLDSSSRYGFDEAFSRLEDDHNVSVRVLARKVKARYRATAAGLRTDPVSSSPSLVQSFFRPARTGSPQQAHREPWNV
jgi:AAA family ATP:ADP antiporter